MSQGAILPSGVIGDRLTDDQLGDVIIAVATTEQKISIDVSVVSALVDEVIEYRSLDGVEALRQAAEQKIRDGRLAAMRAHTGLSDEQAIEGVRNGTLVDPHYAEWMVLIGRQDVIP